jgi:hypothetical protein
MAMASSSIITRMTAISSTSVNAWRAEGVSPEDNAVGGDWLMSSRFQIDPVPAFFARRRTIPQCYIIVVPVSVIFLAQSSQAKSADDRSQRCETTAVGASTTETI